MSKSSTNTNPHTPSRECTPAKIERFRLLDTWVDGLTTASFLASIGSAVEQDRSMLIANHNVNSLALLQRDTAFRRFYEQADLVFVDGLPVVGIARMLGERVSRHHRIAVLDWLWPLCALAEENGWRIVHLGGTPDVLEQAEAEIRRRHPRLAFASIHGYFDVQDPAANEAVLDAVGGLRPTVLLVGMGMPRQEHWLAQNANKLPSCVTITVGGILSYLSDDRPTPPRWLGRWGVEWVFRLATEPRRLWRRYLVEPLVLVSPVLSALRGRRRPRER